MSQVNQVDCPICGSFFSASSVNEHVNKCLNAKEASPPNEKRCTPLGTKSRHDCMNSSPLGKGTLLQRSSGFFGKRSERKVNNSLMTSPATGTLKRSLSNSFSNLAGNSDANPLSKRLKQNEAPKTSKSEPKSTENNAGLSSGTSNSISGHSSTSSSSGKKDGQKSKNSQFLPLAERMRPKTLAEYVGQSKVLGENSLLRTLLEAEEIPSMILWGPPGCGKVIKTGIFLFTAREGGTDGGQNTDPQSMGIHRLPIWTTLKWTMPLKFSD